MSLNVGTPSTIEFEELLPTEYYQTKPTLVEFIVRSVPAQDASAALKEVCHAFPLDDSWGHLRRARKDTLDPSRVQILVCPQSETLERTESDVISLWTVQQVLVPSNAPVTSEQLKVWNQVWPIAFKKPRPHAPGCPEVPLPRRVAELAVKLFRQIAGGSQIDDSGYITSDSSVLSASSRDGRWRNYADHVAFKLVVAVEESAEVDQPKSDSEEIPRTASKRTRSKPMFEYLCTGGWVILTQEPCVACGMALLHSRVTGVVFLVPNPTAGAFTNPAISLHNCSKLNHRFRVFCSTVSPSIEGPMDLLCTPVSCRSSD